MRLELELACRCSSLVLEPALDNNWQVGRSSGSPPVVTDYSLRSVALYRPADRPNLT